MELLFFIILAIIFFGIFGDGEKHKSKQKRKSRSRAALSPKAISGASGRADENYPRDWKNYEAAERSEHAGMQDDVDPTELYKISKDRIDRARKVAAGKLSDSLQSFETTTKTARNLRSSGVYVAKQPPLVRDMNLSRKLFLSGGRSTIFGERQKKSFGFKTILGLVGLAIIGLHMFGALGS